MKFVVNNLCYWIAPGQQIPERLVSSSSELDLNWIPAMQRRRLSPYMKMALHTLRSAQAEHSQVAVNFSSRHGDLPKTAKLLNTLVEQAPLSPTAFGLSVHNATTGIFSITGQNRAAMNAIAGGAESIIDAITDGYARVKSGLESQILINHTDSVLPEEYLCFADELQIDHSVSFMLSTQLGNDAYFELNKLSNHDVSPPSDCLPLSVQLADAFIRKEPKTVLVHQQSAWMLQYHGS